MAVKQAKIGVQEEGTVLASRSAIQAESRYPGSYMTQLASLGQTPVQLRVPVLSLRVSDDDRDGILVVTDSFSGVYGEGEDNRAAIDDYIDSLVAHFLDLDENADILAPRLRDELERMRLYL